MIGISLLTKSLGYYTLATLSLYAMSPLLPRAAFLARSLAAYLSLSAAALFGILSSIALRSLGHPSLCQYATARCFHHLMRLSTGTYFTIDDPQRVLERTRPAVFVGNHQTELDIAMLGAVFPKHCHVTAKASLKWVPFLGWFMALSGTVFIDRGDSQGARSALDGAVGRLRERRQSVYMFPEGTRSYAMEPSLLPFKKGAFHLAVQAGVPIVPCVVANYSHVFAIGAMRFRSGAIPVKVLDPIPTTGLTAANVPELVKQTEELMLRELIALTAKARGQPIPVPAAVPASPQARITEITAEDNDKPEGTETVETVETVQVSH